MTNDLWNSLALILPMIILVAWACLLLLVDLFIPKERKGITAGLAALGLLVSLGFVLASAGQGAASGFGGMIILDDFARFLNILLLASGLAGVALAYDYLQRTDIEHSEYYVLLLFAISGMMLIGMSADLIIVFLSLELLSIPLYVMAGIAVPRLTSEEASIK